MNAALFLDSPPARPPRAGWGRITSPVVVVATMVAVAAAARLTRAAPGWVAVTLVALVEFYGLKVLTLLDHWGRAKIVWILAYLALWPGMNAAAFFNPRNPTANKPAAAELAAAVAKLLLGVALAVWTMRHAFDAPTLLVGWTGMVGVIFIFHFGLFHMMSWLWRRAGVEAPPLMRVPIAARSLAEFWGERWNVAFAESGRRFLLRPLARHWGVRWAGAFVFLVSGLVHESAISLPARGGWGGPTLYFLLQAAGAAIEKTPFGRRIGFGAGWRGWSWTLLVTVVPLPLLFHRPLIERVVVPLFQTLAKEAL